MKRVQHLSAQLTAAVQQLPPQEKAKLVFKLKDDLSKAVSAKSQKEKYSAEEWALRVDLVIFTSRAAGRCWVAVGLHYKFRDFCETCAKSPRNFRGTHGSCAELPRNWRSFRKLFCRQQR